MAVKAVKPISAGNDLILLRNNTDATLSFQYKAGPRKFETEVLPPGSHCLNKNVWAEVKSDSRVHDRIVCMEVQEMGAPDLADINRYKQAKEAKQKTLVRNRAERRKRASENIREAARQANAAAAAEAEAE